jgi:hypothetical protein
MADPLSFRWSPEFLALVDERRGAVSRSAYVRESLEQRWQREGLATGPAAGSTGVAAPDGGGLTSAAPVPSVSPRASGLAAKPTRTEDHGAERVAPGRRPAQSASPRGPGLGETQGNGVAESPPGRSRVDSPASPPASRRAPDRYELAMQRAAERERKAKKP